MFLVSGNQILPELRESSLRVKRRGRICLRMLVFLLVANLSLLFSITQLTDLWVSAGPAKVRGGSTPGVKTPGDNSYVTTLCSSDLGVIPKARNLGGFPNNSYSRKLLRTGSTRKLRPPAWLPSKMNKDTVHAVHTLIMHFSEQKIYCPFYERSCLVPDKEYSHFFGSKFGRKIKIKVAYEEWLRLPMIEKGSWGTCALVALGDNMLSTPRGEEIDSHDTVIRLGELPIHRYERYVGSRTDVTWTRRRAKMSSFGTISKGREDVRLYIGGSNGNTQIATLKIVDSMLQKDPIFGDFEGFPDLIYKLFEIDNWNKEARGKKKKRSPSTGFRSALLLIFSGYCERLDLYGFSYNCGGAYYNTKHLMQISHNCELESWILHYIMKNINGSGVCVYL